MYTKRDRTAIALHIIGKRLGVDNKRAIRLHAERVVIGGNRSRLLISLAKIVSKQLVVAIDCGNRKHAHNEE